MFIEKEVLSEAHHRRPAEAGEWTAFVFNMCKTARVAFIGLLAALSAADASATNPQPDVAKNEVDLIEVNYLHDKNGRLVHKQVIYYYWSPEHSEYFLRAWKILKCQEQIPVKNANRSGLTATWYDDDVLRSVTTKVLKVSYTQHDPIHVARQYLAKDECKKLMLVKMSTDAKCVDAIPIQQAP